MFENPDRDRRCDLLKTIKNIAVVGLSPNQARPSYGVSEAMQGFGFNVIPVHPRASEVLDKKVYRRLADIPCQIDLVNVFRRPQYIDEIVDECLALKLKAIWIQQGIVNEPAAARAKEGGMFVVMDRCIYVDYLSCSG